MTDCPNAEIRDLLPDYLHAQLPDADAARVARHVTTCVECAKEFELLKSAFAVRPRVDVNTAGIVALLPTSGPVIVGDAPSVALPPITATGSHHVRPISSAPSVPARWFAARGLIAIAAAALLAVGGGSIVLATHASESGSTAGQALDSARLAVAPPTISSVVAETATSLPSTGAAVKGAVLSVGELSEYSDAEIESVIKRVEQWDGAAAADPLPGVPLLPSSSGGVR
jgi:hypothetical protein